jgi:hypothetical protein
VKRVYLQKEIVLWLDKSGLSQLGRKIGAI